MQQVRFVNIGGESSECGRIVVRNDKFFVWNVHAEVGRNISFVVVNSKYYMNIKENISIHYRM